MSVIARKAKGQLGLEIFDNSEGYIGDSSTPVLSIKHAANIGKVDVYLDLLFNDRLASAEPTASGVKRGDAVYLGFLIADIKVGVAKSGSTKLAAQTPYWEVEDGKINHVVAVGTPKQLRFLRYRTDNPGD